MRCGSPNGSHEARVTGERWGIVSEAELEAGVVE
jgi:hypothetical protein